jgi:hypothetical protein
LLVLSRHPALQNLLTTKTKTWVSNDRFTQNPPVSFFHESTG